MSRRELAADWERSTGLPTRVVLMGALTASGEIYFDPTEVTIHGLRVRGEDDVMEGTS